MTMITAPADSRCIVTVTTGLYWSMMESGLGLLAACLPTMYCLIRLLSRSVATRKASTNRLTSSERSQPRRPGLYASNFGRRDDSMESKTQIVSCAARPAHIESHAMRDMAATFKSFDSRKGQIWITNSITRTENIV